MKYASSKSNEELKDLLNRVIRLRLFCNTNEEMGDYISYNLQSNNGIKKMSAFTARCIFRELSKEMQQTHSVPWNMEDVLAEYEQASAFYDRYIKGKEIARNDCFVLLNSFYVNDYQPPHEKLFLISLLPEIRKQDIYIPILLLLMLKVLPLYTSTKGDVKDIKSDFRIVYSFLKEFIGLNERLVNLPILDRYEKEVNRGDYCNRLFLICTAAVTLEKYQNFTNPDNLYAQNSAIRDKILLFNLNDTIWAEPNMLTTPTVFWRFEQLATSYFLYRYTINTEQKSIRYIRYEVTFLREKDQSILMTIDPPTKILAFLENNKMFKDNSYWYVCEMDNYETPNVIELQKLLDFGTSELPDRKLIKLQNERLAMELKQCLSPKGYKIINQYPETDYNIVLSDIAITSEYIYFSKQQDEQGKENSYYRVPKSLNDGLHNITSNDYAGVMKLNGRIYLAFAFIILYLDVTDADACQKSGVEVVEKIEI